MFKLQIGPFRVVHKVQRIYLNTWVAKIIAKVGDVVQSEAHQELPKLSVDIPLLYHAKCEVVA
jgi:chitodextrinase